MLIIRPAADADLDHLVALLKVLFAIEEDFEFDEALQHRGLEMMLANPQGCVLVAEERGRVIGMCTGQLTISTAEGGVVALVEDVVVDPACQGRGTGRRLLEALGEWAAIRGATRLQLLADRDNQPALDFYAKLGWQGTKLICLRKK